MTRLAWSRRSPEQIATLRAMAGRYTAAQIGEMIGASVQQVYGAAHRRKISLVLQPGSPGAVALARSRARGVAAAWADPVKRQAWDNRPLGGAAVAGAPRRQADAIGLRLRMSLAQNAVYAAAAAAVRRGLSPDVRDDVISDLVLAHLSDGLPLAGMAGAAARLISRALRHKSPRFVSLDAPKGVKDRRTLLDLLADDVERF